MKMAYQSGAGLALTTAVLLAAFPAAAQTAGGKKSPPPAAAQGAAPLPVLPVPPVRQDDPRPPSVVPDPNAPPPPPRPPVIGNPSWARTPAPEYPEAAMAGGVSAGQVTLNCLVSPQGAISDCRIVSETPQGFGFGESAIAAAHAAQISPRTVDGAADGTRFTFTTRYLAPEPMPGPDKVIIPAR